MAVALGRAGRPRILILTPYFEPGYESGGPVRSLSSLVNQLGKRFNFTVITADRVPGAINPYPGVPLDSWIERDSCAVMYISRSKQNPRHLLSLLRHASYNALYLNSVFSPRFSIVPLLLRLLGLLPRYSIILSPRGELSSRALGQKRIRKTAYLCIARLVGVYDEILWQAASREEADDIRTQFGADAEVTIAGDLADPMPLTTSRVVADEKVPGSLKVVFLGRLARIKNLHFVLDCLRFIRGTVHLDIYGPIEDRNYWRECVSQIDRLPKNIVVKWGGAVEPDRVPRILGAYELLFLPSESESFGHVILEALSVGCPVLIGDRTPWKNLAKKGCGWDLPLAEPHLFVQRLQQCVDADAAGFAVLRAAAYKESVEYFSDHAEREKTATIFSGLVAQSTLGCVAGLAGEDSE